MSGDAEKVQLVALLIISDLEHKKPSLQVSAQHTALTHNVRQRRIWSQQAILAPGNTEPLNHLFTPAHTWLRFGGGC